MKRILLVDDNQSFITPLAAALRRVGYEVAVANDGGFALQMYAQRPFDLVITDLIMPGKEGVETIVELRKLAPAVRIIAMSGGGMLGAEVSLTIARQLGAIQTLAKPFTLPQILQVIAAQLAAGPADAPSLGTVAA